MASALLEEPVPLLAAFLTLSVLAWPAEAAVGGSNENLPGLLILLFLTCRVWHGRPTSRMLLILISVGEYSGAAFHVARPGRRTCGCWRRRPSRSRCWSALRCTSAPGLAAPLAPRRVRWPAGLGVDAPLGPARG